MCLPIWFFKRKCDDLPLLGHQELRELLMIKQWEDDWIWISHLKLPSGKQPDSGSICAPLCFPLLKELSRLCLSTQAVFLNFPDYKYQQKILIKYSSTSDLLKKRICILIPRQVWGTVWKKCRCQRWARDYLVVFSLNGGIFLIACAEHRGIEVD